MNIYIKYLITAFLVVIISEIAKYSDRLGAFIGSLPTVTLLTLFWLYIERQSVEKISNHAFYTFCYVLPSLPGFLVFALLLPKYGFLTAIVAAVACILLCFGAFALLLSHFGINLI